MSETSKLDTSSQQQSGELDSTLMDGIVQLGGTSCAPLLTPARTSTCARRMTSHGSPSSLLEIRTRKRRVATHHGERNVPIQLRDGQKMSITFQVCDVKERRIFPQQES